MKIYERILNILLEARVEMFIQDRLDEKKLIGKQKKLDVNKSGKLDAQDFKMLRSGKRADEGMVKAKNKAMKNAFTDKLRHHEAPPDGRSGQINLSSREKEAAEDHEVRLARKVKFPTNASEKRAVGRDNLRKGDTYRSDEAKKVKPSLVQKALSDYSEPSVSAKALKKAGEARRAGDKPEARRQVGRSQKLDKPQLP